MSKITTIESLRASQGHATGIQSFDNFLIWKGLPSADLTLLCGKPGTGATSLWLSTASKIRNSNKFAGWINTDCELSPQHLQSKNIDPQKFVLVQNPEHPTELFSVLENMISSSMFELIGCYLPSTFKQSHLEKLKQLSKQHKVALVFISAEPVFDLQNLFALVIDCQRNFFTVKKAAQRPTPFTISGTMIYQTLFPDLAQKMWRLVC